MFLVPESEADDALYCDALGDTMQWLGFTAMDGKYVKALRDERRAIFKRARARRRRDP